MNKKIGFIYLFKGQVQLLNMFGLVPAMGNSTPSSHTHTRDQFPLELINTE